MAIPVFFTAELMPFQDIAGTVVDEALAALGNELKGFFDGKADFVIKDGHESVVGLTYDASATDPNLPVVIGTLVAGFRGVSEQEALTIAQTFSSKNFQSRRRWIRPQSSPTPQTLPPPQPPATHSKEYGPNSRRSHSLLRAGDRHIA